MTEKFTLPERLVTAEEEMSKKERGSWLPEFDAIKISPVSASA